MLYKIIIILFYIILSLHGSIAATSAEEHENYRVVEELKEKPVHPVIIQDIVYITKKGLIGSVDGTVCVIKDQSDRYEELVKGSEVGFEDILELYPGSKVTIKSEGIELSLQANEKTRWFVLKRKVNDNYIMKR